MTDPPDHPQIMQESIKSDMPLIAMKMAREHLRHELDAQSMRVRELKELVASRSDALDDLARSLLMVSFAMWITLGISLIGIVVVIARTPNCLPFGLYVGLVPLVLAMEVRLKQNKAKTITLDKETIMNTQLAPLNREVDSIQARIADLDARINRLASYK
jgi:hypothetical protein